MRNSELFPSVSLAGYASDVPALPVIGVYG